MFNQLKAVVRGLLNRRRTETELDEELGFHVEMETRANIDAGMSPAEARRVALRDLGGVTQITEADREARATFLDSIAHDVTFALRQMRRSPGVTIAALLTLALGHIIHPQISSCDSRGKRQMDLSIGKENR